MKVFLFEEFSLMKYKFTLGAFIPTDSPHLFTKHKGLYFLQPLCAAAAPVLVFGNNTLQKGTYIGQCYFNGQKNLLKNILKGENL